MKENKIFTENLEKLGKRYERKYLANWEKGKLETKSWQALKFFFSHSFMRGRRDELSAEYYEFTTTVLFNYFNTTSIEKPNILFEKLTTLKRNNLFDTDNIKELKKEKRNSIKHPEFERKIKNKNLLVNILTTKTKIKVELSDGNTYTKDICLQNDTDLLMVLDTLNFMATSSDKVNLYAYFKNLIKTNKIENAYSELIKLSGIGDKISTFFLRDIAIMNNYNLAENQLKYVFPVDTWVAQITSLIANKSFSAERPDEIKNYFIENHSESNLPLIAAGIWYLGFNSLNIAIEYIIEKKLKGNKTTNG